MLEIATCLNLESEQLILEMRSCFAVRDRLLHAEDYPGKEAEDLRWKVLKEVRAQELALADRFLSSFLLSPSTSIVPGHNNMVAQFVSQVGKLNSTNGWIYVRCVRTYCVLETKKPSGKLP